jgi:ATP-dependent exoDNAse (exonuclease V) beta subunit
MRAFRERLDGLDSVGGIAEEVFQRYGYDGEYADQLLHTIQTVYDGTTMSRGNLIRYIERGIEEGATHEVHTGAGEDSVLVQTIHATKGLEHPIVIMANMNRYRFPPSGGGSSAAIRYEDPIGLRQATVYAEDHGQPFVYDDWKYDILRMTLPTEYDEERRLLYVAITRAEHHVLFSAGERPNQFLEELPVEIEPLEPDIRESGPPETEQAHLQIGVPEPSAPRHATPHTVMDDDIFDRLSEGLGREFGNRVHAYAEAYALNQEPERPESEEPDFAHVRDLINGLSGELFIEQPIQLPVDIDGQAVTISGVVDLVHRTEDCVEIYDYKTDRTDRAESEYQVQLSMYHAVLANIYPDCDVVSRLVYTETGEVVEIPRLDETELRRVLRNRFSQIPD